MKHKRLIPIIVLVIALIIPFVLGWEEFVKSNLSNANSSEIVTSQTKIQQNLENSKIEEAESDTLTSKDKTVKSEIAKYTETKVDFRYNKQQKFNEKSYNLTFSKMGGKVSRNLADRITYKNEKGDEFIYSTKTGDLVITDLKSLKVPKTDDSITIEKAQVIAEKFAKANCDFDQYSLFENKESKQGYVFDYCKYIYGYKTNDSVYIVVSFNGDVVWSAIGCNLPIDYEKISVSKKWFEDKINESTTKNNAVLQDAWIEIEDDGQLYFDIQCIVGDSSDDGYPMIYRNKIP